jgi:hypothetical protein
LSMRSRCEKYKKKDKKTAFHTRLSYHKFGNPLFLHLR